MEPKVTITFTLSEANIMLAGLAKLPFETSADLIARVRKDAMSQIDPVATGVDTAGAVGAEVSAEAQ
jgi:hypothetical protein